MQILCWKLKIGSNRASARGKLARTAAALILFLVAATASVEGGPIGLAWDPPSLGSSVAGYRVLYGTQSSVYTTSIDVGAQTSWTFDPPDSRTYYIAVCAYAADGEIGPPSNEVSIAVAPLTLATPGDQYSAEGDLIGLGFVATGSPVTFGATNLPAGLTINTNTGTIVGQIDYSASVGSPYAVAVAAADAQGQTASVAFAWTVRNTDRAPSVANPGPQTSAENGSVSLAIAARDPDGDVVTFSASGLPPGLAINTNNGQVAGTIPFGAAGMYNSIVTASDGMLAASTSFGWTVTKTDRPPLVTNPGAQASLAGTSVSLAIAATDPDGDALSFSASGLPAGLGINATTGVIAGTVPSGAAGTYVANVSATDGVLLSTVSFTWTVTANNTAPQLINPGSQTNYEGDNVSLQLVATDAQANPILFNAANLPPGLKVNRNTGRIQGRLPRGSAGVYQVAVTASDGSLATMQAFVWTVKR